MKNSMILALSLAALLLFSACATIFTGTRDLIHFNSDPPGAKVFINGIERCVTPCEVRVRRSVNQTDAMLKLDGYVTRIFTLDTEFNLVSILNLGSLIGWGVDVISGSIMRYGLRHYDVTLTREQFSALLNPIEIHIDTENKKVDFYVLQKQPVE